MQNNTPSKNTGFQGHSHTAEARAKMRAASRAHWATRRKPEHYRFWALVDKRGPDECWLWCGAIKKHRSESGYGKWQQTSAHKRAYELSVGRVPVGLEVCHSCDVRGCCNPRHLYLATHKQNMEAASQRRRWSLKERHHAAYLSYESARLIKEDYATGRYLQKDLMKKYGIRHSSTISNIILGKTYKTVY